MRTNTQVIAAQARIQVDWIRRHKTELGARPSPGRRTIGQGDGYYFIELRKAR